MDRARMRGLVEGERFAHLATTRPDGAPHLVPIVFALVGETLYTPVDHKPKRTRRLARLEHLRRDPRASVLVDHASDDWDALWWVRLDGTARILAAGDESVRGARALTERYPVYATHPIAGPIIAIDLERWTGWSATG